jgi:hypothetical protein
MVLLGINPLDDFIGNLQKNVGLDKNTALGVAHDVDELIFKSVRDALKGISQQIASEEVSEVKSGANQPAIPQKEDVLAGIERPQILKTTEPSVSVSALPSNKTSMEKPTETLDRGVEIRPNMLPEVEPTLPPEAMKPPQPEMYHENVSPVSNIVESKMNEQVVVPKQEIVIEEKTKLPEKQEKMRPSSGEDPYREPVQ